ncbi:MAG TPA: addiction module protein [Reyranella sp.]|jgi:putative addiction module component (TIGR02574 family)|nr:addiction module protein [Reyranella sp.]
MAHLPIDPAALTVEERLQLIDELRLSLARDAQAGNAEASAALDLYRPLDPEVLAEIVRRADALESDPSSGIRWEDLRDELERKHK